MFTTILLLFGVPTIGLSVLIGIGQERAGK